MTVLTWFSSALQALPFDTSCEHVVCFKVKLYGLTGCNAWTYRSYSMDLQVVLH